MKRNISLILAVTMLLSVLLCGCDIGKATVSTTPKSTGSLSGEGNVEVEVEIPSADANLSGNIQIELPEWDFDLELTDEEVQQFLNDAAMNFSAEDLEALKKMSIQDLKNLIRLHASLLADLKYVMQTCGVNVKIDEKTGEINLDATVLFDVDEAEISQEGKELLKKFMQVYTYVVYHERYTGFISHVIIEGHTDSTGEYEYNQKLSQKRADAVMEYILSDECGLSQEHRDAFRETVSAVGYSWDRLVYDENGVEDKAASRRVSFRFLIEL